MSNKIRYFEKSTDQGLNIYIKFGQKHLKNMRLSSQFENFLVFLYDDLGIQDSITIVIQTKLVYTQPLGWAQFNLEIKLFLETIKRYYGNNAKQAFATMAHEFGHIEHRLIDPASWSLEYMGNAHMSKSWQENYANEHSQLKLEQFNASQYDEILVAIFDAPPKKESTITKSVKIYSGCYRTLDSYKGLYWNIVKGSKGWQAKASKWDTNKRQNEYLSSPVFSTKKAVFDWLEGDKNV